MNVELEQEKVNLIKKIITSDKKYLNNEDLYEDFFNETYKRSFMIIKNVKNEASLESYLKKIVTTSIINVLKDSGRVQRTKEGFVPTVEKSLDQINVTADNKYSQTQIDFDIADLSDGPEEIVVKKEILRTLIDAVSVANHKYPEKQFLQLYELRFIKGLKQKEIAKEMNLSQSEVSKRLFMLMKEVKDSFNK